MNRELWERAVAFHGHACPGLAIGVRVCQAAIARLGISRAANEELVCVCENDACGVDAVQAILGCTLGKGNLILRLTGKQAFTFFTREGGGGEGAGTSASAFRLYLKAQNPGLSREAYLRFLLEAPVDELFAVVPAGVPVPVPARIFASVPCACCGEAAAEPFIRVCGGERLCRDCAGDGD